MVQQPSQRRRSGIRSSQQRALMRSRAVRRVERSSRQSRESLEASISADVNRRELLEEGDAGLLFAARRYDGGLTPFWKRVSSSVPKATHELFARPTRPVALMPHRPGSPPQPLRSLGRNGT
jgi:hypothetical protein